MGDKTKIEWADATWSPVTGCTKVSAGCKYCYSERLVGRFDSLHGFVPFTTVECHPDRLEQPLHWRKPRRIFVVSMGDLFHEAVPDEFIGRVWSVMLSALQHTYQILTKRPDRMAEFVARAERESTRKGLNDSTHIWLGVSVEDQATADVRIPLLLKTPAAVRFISYEPALSVLDLDPYLWYAKPTTLRTPRLDWVIAGGESGPKARPSNPAWFRTVRDQCQSAGVPFLFKQWGEWCQGPGDGMTRAGKRDAGRLLDGNVWHEFPEGR